MGWEGTNPLSKMLLLQRRSSKGRLPGKGLVQPIGDVMESTGK